MKLLHSMHVQTAKHWLNMIVLLGCAIWIIAWIIHRNEWTFFTEVEQLLFFGYAVVTPLAMRLALQPDRNEHIPYICRAAIQFHPLALAAAAIALILEPGATSASFAAVWQVQTVLLALYGLKRLLLRPTLAIEEICIEVGLLYVPISGIWLIAYSADYPLFSFDRAFVLLTAVHFTFISPGALVIAGMIGRKLFGSRAWRFYRVVAWFAVISPVLVAFGISMTQFFGLVWLEAGSVLILTSSFLMLALLYFFNGLPTQSVAQALTGLSGTALLVTMGFALAYSLGRLTGRWSLSISEMIQWHGWLNAIGFTFCGLLAWNIATPAPNSILPGIPFSRLPWRWYIGPDFFQRIGAIDSEASSAVTGIVDRLHEREDFNPQSVLPSIIAFYEDTAAHELMVYPEWQRYFRLLARVYKQISKRIGQMNFPTRPETHGAHISSTIIPLSDALDGRERVRGWVRVYTNLRQAVYVAAYASHFHNHNRYMNIAFPLPLGNLTSVLRLETPAENDGGMLLTSYSTRQGDQGVYFVNCVLAVRLPINETIRIYQLESPTGDIQAEHKMWLFGVHFLTLYYTIVRAHANQNIA
jgi:hypothetical protein